MLTATEYSLLVEQAPILIWRARPDKLCDYFNERWLTFRGRSLAQEFGNGWAEGVHPDDFKACLDTYVAAFDKREVFEMYYRLMRYDGKYRWIFDRGVPYFSNTKVFLGYLGSCIDVTERIVAEQELAAKRDMEMRRLAKLLPVCAWCKKVRNDEGYWKDIGDYFLENHQNTTHGMCDDCARHFCERVAPETPSSSSSHRL